MPPKENRVFKYISWIRPQLIIIGIFSFFLLLGYFGIGYTTDELLKLLKSEFAKHGLWIIALSSLIENTFGINVYFPGAVVILTGMSLTKGDIGYALATFLCIYLPVLIANSINFFIGRKIGFKKKKDKGNQNIDLFFILTLWHPYLASIASFTAGSRKFSYAFFLIHFIPISLLMNVIWGVIAYNWGYLFTESSFAFLSLFFIYLTLWIVIDTIKFFKQEQYSDL